MAHFSRLVLILLLSIFSYSANAEFDEIYWEFQGNKFPTPQAAAENYISIMNFNYGNCQTQPISAARWQLNNIDIVQDVTANIKFKICSYSSCNLNCSNSSLDNKVANRVGVCRPGRVYNPYTYQCQDQCQSSGEWQDVDSRPGLGWQVTGLYGCNGGCLVRYDAYTDLDHLSTNVRSRKNGWMCSSDYCFGSEQLSTQCGYHYSCPDGFVLNADGSCGSQQCPAGTVDNGLGGCRQECAVNEIWDGNSCVLPACPVGQHREDGVCVDNQCPAGQIQDLVTKECINPEDHQCPVGTAKNLNGECATDSDGDGKPDDSDGDGTPDSEDNDDDNDGTPDWGDSDSDGDGDTDPPNCPEGTTANQYGNCIADGTGDSDNPPSDGGDNPPSDGGDNPPPPSGDGGNTPPPSGGGGGSTTGSATSSANCETQPQCQGDPIQCATLRQVWEMGCLVLEPRKSTEPANDIPSQVIDLKTQVSISDSNQGVNFGAGCPADRTVSVIGKSFTISYRQLCEFAVAIRPVVIGVAAVNSARLLVK